MTPSLRCWSGILRRRIAASGAASGAAAIAPGLGTLIALGTVTGQSLYALEQQTELVMAIATVYGHELTASDERLLEALVVVGHRRGRHPAQGERTGRWW